MIITNQHTRGNKSYAILALCTQLVLSVGACIFYKERMLFSDAPHILFKIINEQHLQIAEHRYGSFITQLFPYIGMKLHLSLKVLTLFYSLSFNLFFATTALLLVFKYRRYDLGLMFSLYLTLFVSDTYFWTNNEVHQGIAWLFVAFAASMHMAASKRPMAIAFPIFTILFALAIWTHPLVMLVAMFMWFFYWLHGRDWPFTLSQSIIYSIILLALCYAKFYQGMHHGYDSGKIEFVTQLRPERIKAVLSAPQLRFFLKGCITNYWLVVLLSLAGVISLIQSKKYLLAGYTVLAAFGYLLLLCITYWDVQSLRFYMESEYMPLAIICCAPFLYYTLPHLKVNHGLVLLLLVFIVRLAYIYHSSAIFTSRVALLENINAHMLQRGITKAIVTNTSEEANKTLIMNWGAPVESMVLSQLNGESPQRTFIIPDEQQLKAFHTASRDTLLGCFEKVSATHINAAYFQMYTTTLYQTIDYNTLMK